MAPLGPFNGKSFCTSISPWIVTVEALKPFEVPLPKNEHPVAAYLSKQQYSYHMTLTADLIDIKQQTANLCTSKLDDLYWTFEDMIAHHTINGCALRTGDLLATGTVSGESEGTFGCLMEITVNGKKPITVKGIGERKYLEDGDAVRLSGWAGELGSDQCVGFGECFGVIEPALEI
jgi:fumarylacetoacetase